jgi:uncharacterized protein
MKFEITRAKELNTAKWAGGTTTQLAIYPAGTEYGKFNFTFRMSYATVEVPASTFTFMPGVTRHLMILEGKLKIDHTGRYKKELTPFDQDVFDGEWPTTAEGMVKDFNLMTRNGAEGKLNAVHLKEDEEFVYTTGKEADYSGIYVQRGTVGISFNENRYELSSGDFLYLIFEKGNLHKSIHIHAKEKAELVFGEITLK